MGNNNINYIPPRRSRFQGKCNHCRKQGHRREDCWFLKNNQFKNAERANIDIPVSENAPQNRIEEEVVLINKISTVRNEESGLNKIRKDIWTTDSGASSHMSNNVHSLINMRKNQSKVKIGSEDYIKAACLAGSFL